ncbi:MAG: Smr/MutS family protein [Acidiferrobacterales bacterium]
MSDERKQKEQRNSAFLDWISDVRPIKQDRVTPFRALRAPVPEQSNRDAEDVMQNLLSGQHDPAEIETGEEVLYVRSGVRPATVRKLRRAHYAIEAELDLHGQRVPNARELINAFLRDALLAGRRCVKIIHGKGLSSDAKLPILKGKVSVWLARRGDVLAFCSARANDGGTGAVYVLLKRR